MCEISRAIIVTKILLHFSFVTDYCFLKSWHTAQSSGTISILIVGKLTGQNPVHCDQNKVETKMTVMVTTILKVMQH